MVDGFASLTHKEVFKRGPTQAASLVVCSKCKEMYGRILKSVSIVNLYRGMSKLKLKINVNLCLLNKIDERSRIDKMSLHDIKVS